jgi:protein-L-isoaspartate(D-aspartate) O-methyltransferase
MLLFIAVCCVEKLRTRMVDEQLAERGIRNERVLDAMRAVPRHEFVPAERRKDAYEDRPLPIGYDQTISQPYIVALMTQELQPAATDKVLEIGTGSGYQAAVLAKLVRDVYSIEIVEPLGTRATADLRRLGFKNVHTKIGDGYAGWPEEAPFVAVIVTCAPDKVPPALVEQLKDGGRMVIPVGDARSQKLFVMVKRGGKMETRDEVDVRFVPMTRGPARKR